MTTVGTQEVIPTSCFSQYKPHLQPSSTFLFSCLTYTYSPSLGTIFFVWFSTFCCCERHVLHHILCLVGKSTLCVESSTLCCWKLIAMLLDAWFYELELGFCWVGSWWAYGRRGCQLGIYVRQTGTQCSHSWITMYISELVVLMTSREDRSHRVLRLMEHCCCLTINYIANYRKDKPSWRY